MNTASGEDAAHRVERSLRSLLGVVSSISTDSEVARQRVLVAVSGGADSVFLLVMLHRLAPLVGFDLSALTVNHRIRAEAESAGDADFVEALCASLSPPVPCDRVDLAVGSVARLAAERGRGIEDAARALRYREMESAAKRRGDAFVATGHTRNDRLETILMRVLQGSGGSPLAGILPRRGRYIRPLLGVDRSEIVAWLSDHGYSWREDASNADDRFFRNRVRSRLVPVLDEVYPGWKTGIIALSEKALIDEDVCRSFVVPPWTADGRSVSCDSARFDSLPEAVRLRHLRDGLSLLGVSRRISFRHIKRMMCFDGTAGPAASRVIGAGLLLERRQGRLFLSADIVHPYKSGYLVYVRACGRFSTPFGTVEVTPSEGGVSLNGSFGPFSLPLLIRSRIGGDAVRLADGGHKTVKKLLNEWSVTEAIRDIIPVIECGGAVRAVYGAPFGYPDWRDGL